MKNKKTNLVKKYFRKNSILVPLVILLLLCITNLSMAKDNQIINYKLANQDTKLSFSETNIPVKEEDFTQYVNPNIGSDHSRWFFYTPASLPFGMAKLAPSTNGSYGNKDGWQAVGYEDSHSSIEGFACFHEFQIGGVMLMPVVGELKTQPGKLDNPEAGYRSKFNKANEKASPGYYSVILDDYNTIVELTATERVGYQRYQFPETDSAYIIFDIGNQLGESGAVKDAHIELIDNQTIEGYVTTIPEYIKKYQEGADLTMYFYIKLDKPIEESYVFHRGESLKKAKEIEGIGSTMAVRFNTKEDERILAKIGLSYTSVDNAKLNYESEAKEKSFEEVQRNAHEIWKEKLGRIRVSGKSNDDKVKFYTALYHAILGRGLASDINGQYPKHDGGVGQIETDANGKPIHNHYNSDAIWGAFWNLTQLWTLAYPEYYADWVSSQLLVYKDSGWLSDGIANSRYVSGVGTNFVSLAIASAYNCGIRNFDVDLAYKASLKNEIDGENRPLGAGKSDVGLFVKNGFAPYSPEQKDNPVAEKWMFGTSHTLEYAFSSYAVAQFAKQLGKQKDYELLLKLSESWKNVFDTTTQLMRPRLTDGSFIKDFDPMAPWVGFQEGNAIQYTFYVPHEPKELIAMIGENTFNNRLDSIFTLSQQNVFGGGKELNAFSGVHALYNHGNQPSLHISWMFNFSGKPYLTQKWTRTICDEFYGVTGEHGYGYGQDEDQGQLGAWYVMAAMGLFDVKGLTEENPQMQLGSPSFDRIEIKLNNKYYNGDSFVIEAENNSKNNKYIQSISLNGKEQQNVFIPFKEIVTGSRVKLIMGDNPNKQLK